MRGTAISTTLLTVLAVAVIGAPCSTTGPLQKTFDAGALVIPMDNCYQTREGGAAHAETNGCNSAADDGVFRAYGLVYFLLKHDVPVYWAIDGAQPNAKTSATAPDVTVPVGPVPLVRKLNWSTFGFDEFGAHGGEGALDSTKAIKYIGGPFIIEAKDKAAALALLQSDSDFARWRSERYVDIHEVENGFTARQVRPLSGQPPKIAILNIAGPKTSADVMIKYAEAAGFDWTCNGACTLPDGSDCDCAGGISKLDSNCTKARMLSRYGITVNNGPGRVYDVLCDKDFLPDYSNPSAPDFTKSTLLSTTAGSYNYKLLWAPHWETPRGTCPAGLVHPSGSTLSCGTVPDPSAAIGSGSRNLADWLACIQKFVNAGNNLFAECHAIVSLEGGYGLADTNGPIKEYGLPITRFQSTASMNRSQYSAIGASAVDEFLPTEPTMQIADFTFSVVSGNVSAYLADPSGNAGFGMPASSYNGGVKHLITQNNGSPNLDVATSIVPNDPEAGPRGAIVYLGGHDYSNQTAGTRIVLNTLFNLGFACADPKTAAGAPVTCSTGLLGACATGTLRCASAGGLACVGPSPQAQDSCNGTDDNCNGIIDDPETCSPPVCTEGTHQACPESMSDPAHPPQGECKAGQQTCTSGGYWGACQGAVLPTPEVCNGKDDDCDGTVDNGNLCPTGYACTGGICLPSTCNNETARCPIGFTCDATNHPNQPCQPDACAGGATCPTGTVCISGACKDPCQGVTCGSGSSCSGGQCIAGGCALSGCASGQTCVAGSCVADPCKSASCPEGTFCRPVPGNAVGDCVRSCSYVSCPPGQQCGNDGFCESTCTPACASGQACVNGACAADPCAGVSCGSSQACRNGACVDGLCANVICPLGRCDPATGQCVEGGKTISTQRDVPPAKSGGCASTGPGGLFSLAALLAFLWRRRTGGRPAALRVPSLRRAGVAGLAAAALALATTTAGCSKGGTPACKNGQSACGSACVDLTSAADSCGVCGKTCSAGFQCVAGSCAFATGNPYLKSVTPGTLAVGGTAKLTLAGEGFREGAKVRVTGPGPKQEGTLVLDDPTGAAAHVEGIDLDGWDLGTAEVRVVNPPTNLISNAVTVSVQAQTMVRRADPSSASQDQTSEVSVALTGAGFVQGAVVSLTLGGNVHALDTTYVSAGHLTAKLVPSTLAVGSYDLTVTNPGSAPTAPIGFTILEGTPGAISLSQTCGVVGSTAAAVVVTGANLYPTSSVRVTGGSIVNSPLPDAARCASGTDALGRCVGGLLATVDLSGIPPNCYAVTVVNPGPLTSPAAHFVVAASCSPAPTCP